MSHRTRVVEGGYHASPMWHHSAAPDSTVSESAAFRYLLRGQSAIYAMRLHDGVIKIGCSRNVANRRSMLHGEILAFRLGGFDDEKKIHDQLRPHRATYGREFYRASPEVLAVVNDMRDDFNLPHIAA